MENSDTPKVRRPLPTPGAPTTQRPSTPVVSSQPVPPSSFYASSKPPPLPTRPKNPGSNHTAYVPPVSDPPCYGSPAFNNSPSFRQPELVTEETVAEEDDIVPDLIPQTDDHGWPTEAWPTGDASWQTATPSWTADQSNYMTSNRADVEFTIDGRSAHEETHWWDPEERERNKRPGPGILPPVLAELLHDPNHSLFSVHVTSPPILAIPPTTPSAVREQSSVGPSPSTSTLIPNHAPNDTVQPSEDEVRMAVPHPHAYYCPKDNGWVILIWKSSSVSPPLATSFQKRPHPPLPDQNRRRRTSCCIEEGDQPFGKTNKTHHFHKYERAVDSHKLTVPFREDEWQSLEATKQRRRIGTIISPDLNISAIKAGDIESLTEGEANEEEGKLLDLYVCCQCSFYCVTSGVIPGVIPRKHIDELVREKRNSPPVGKTGDQAAVHAAETLILALENKLWKGNHRMIKVHSSGFQSKVGWNPNMKRVFELLGFVEEVVERDSTLRPPVTDIFSHQGKQNRRKLLRAWVELGAWLTDFKRIHASQFKEWKEHKLYVQLDSAREMYQTAIGAHPDQIPRGGLSDPMRDALRPIESSWNELGLTPTTYSADLLAFAYLAQCRCDPAGTPRYFTHFSNIVKHLEEYGSCPTQLQDLLVMEQSRDRFTINDIENAAVSLGFGTENVIRVDYDEEIPDDFVENAWKDAVKRSWRDPVRGSETHRLANDAFRILAEARGSARLRRTWDAGRNFMNPDRAFDTLEIPKDVDDDMVIMVYGMRLEETPLQVDRMREAISVIAEVRDSDRLRQFIATGQDPGQFVAPTRPDLPRGLNQLGNTCYLNSLLQYFYTIKDLREAVIPMSKLDLKALDDEKLSEEDLKRHRVGGRLVTRREITRSRKFINQLAELFFNLEYCEATAVTPTIELAKLALITSRDEEEDEVDRGGTDSSNDTDATLVEDAPARPSTLTSPHPSQSPGPSPDSILGKRPRDIDQQRGEMEIDSPISQSPKEKDGFVVIPPHKTSASPPPYSTRNDASGSKVQTVDQDGDVAMQPNSLQKPAPPPRKRAEPSESTMMFGKQHDVAECMDNCMFQIETALLKFDALNEGTDKTSVVKRLFYGKIRQRLTGTDGASKSRPSIHEKEDLFSHLPVNVANDGIDIYDGLSGYFDDMVDFEGRKARMEMTLVDLPPILQIQLQRVQFNRETLQPYKSQAYVKFGENLYMDRFLDSVDPSRKARSKAIQTELNACRERARLLVEGKDAPYASSLQHTREFLASLQDNSIPGVDDELLNHLDTEQARVLDEIEHLRTRVDILKVELEAIWRDCTKAAYELTSVFIHRGSSPSWGHYFFYSRHLPGSPDSWFKYNDSDVTVVSKDEVLADTTGSTANPYLLVFARKGSDVVDTVKRFDPAFSS